jgi:serine/threonine protein kinase
VALKSIQLPVNTNSLPKAVFREMESLRQLSNANVISLLDVYPEETNIILVLEHAYSDLGSIISGARHYLDRHFIKQMTCMTINGLKHCHGAGILHRGLCDMV